MSARRAESTSSSGQSDAHAMTLSSEEREAHRAADAQDIGELEEPLDDADLVADLGAAEDRDERPVGALDDCLERAHFALHQASGGTG